MDSKSMVPGEIKTENETASAQEKVFHFQARSSGPSPEVVVSTERRDWGAAIDLISEASNAVRWAEERAQTAEDYSKQLAAFHKEQLKAAEQRAVNAEKRAEAALVRAAEAEAWLARFHDAIVEGFGNNLREPVAARS